MYALPPPSHQLPVIPFAIPPPLDYLPVIPFAIAPPLDYLPVIPFALPPPSDKLPVIPFALPPPSDQLPVVPFAVSSPSDRIETYLAIKNLSDRVAALEVELGLNPRTAEKVTWTAEYKGAGVDRKYKWVSESKGSGERKAKWVTEIEEEGGIDRKYKWLATARRNGFGDVRWSAEFKGKGRNAPVSWEYNWRSSTGVGGDEEEDRQRKKEKKNGEGVHLVEIEDGTPSRAAVAIRKAFVTSYSKGKKELSPQDAALLIQRSYKAHLVSRAQVLRCLRSLAVAKAKLKELRALFCNFHYGNRIAKDAEERQRFSEKIIVLLLTVDGIEGPDYLVRIAKKSMIEELEAMLEVVDPQPPGKMSSMRRRKFDLPEGPVSKEMMAGVAEVVQMLDEIDDRNAC